MSDIFIAPLFGSYFASYSNGAYSYNSSFNSFNTAGIGIDNYTYTIYNNYYNSQGYYQYTYQSSTNTQYIYNTNNNTYSILTVPGAYTTYATSINESGQIVGSYYGNINGVTGTYGFVKDATTNVTTTVDPFGSTYAAVSAANNQGQATGVYRASTSTGSSILGFVQDSAGHTTTIDPAGSSYVNPLALNASGQVVGSYQTATTTLGFLYDTASQTVTTLDFANSSYVEPHAINNRGQIAGTYYGSYDGKSQNFAFVYDPATQNLTTIDPAGSLTVDARAINDKGQVTGSYYGLYKGSYGTFGFFYDPTSGTTTTIDPQGTGYVQPDAINDQGQVAGIAYVNGQYEGFVVNPGLPTIALTSGATAGNQAQLTLTGLVTSSGFGQVAGQTVTITDNGSTVASAVVGASGVFSALVTLPSQGVNTLLASVTDTLGHAAQSLALVDLLDTVAPAIVVTSSPLATNQLTQTITGMVTSGGTAAVVGQTVLITDNGQALGTAIVAADGTFSARVSPLVQGSNSIVARVSDSYGNVGQSAPVVDLVDALPPTIGLTSTAVSGNQPHQTIAGTVTSNGAALVAGQTVTVSDNGTALATAVVASDGTFTTDVLLPNQGANRLVASVTDSYGNTARSSAVVDTLDSIAPAVAAIGTPSAPAAYGVGDTVTITITMSEAVTVAGTPTLALNSGGTATFKALSPDGTTLSFAYIIGRTDLSEGQLAVTGLSLNSGSISDLASNPADLTNASGTLGSIAIDTTPPTVVALTAAADFGAPNLGAGRVVTFTLVGSKDLVVSGTPVLRLTGNRTAQYTGGTGGPQLQFQYVVGAHDNDADLQVVGLGTAGSITDRAGNPLAAVPAEDAGLVVDTVAPAAISVSAVADTPAATLNAGHVVTITVDTSEAVVVDTTAGSPTLLLSDHAVAGFTGASGASLTFSYQVQTGDTETDLRVTSLSTNGSRITDLAGNALGAVSGDLGLVIDTTTPAIAAVTADAGGRTDLGAGQVVTILVATTRPVVVAGGSPTLTLSGGRVASFAGMPDAQTLRFTYTVAGNDTLDDLTVGALSPNGATIKSAAGTPLTGDAAADLHLQLDTTPPTLSGLSATSDTGATDLNAGRVITIRLQTTEPVTVDTTKGLPTLTLSNATVATYTGGSGSMLIFTSVVTPNHDTSHLSVTGLTNAASIVDGAGNAFVGTVSGDLGLSIDTTVAMTTVSAQTDSGALDLNANHVVTITVNADKPITVDQTHGALTLALSDGGIAYYTGGTGTKVLTFRYTVGSTEHTSDLTVSGVSPTSLGTATDLAGNPLVVAGDLALVIDTTAPMATLSAAAAGATILDAGQVATITLNASEKLLVETSLGGPTLTLGSGAKASYVGGSGTGTLTFRYVVAAGDNFSPLTVTGLDTTNGAVTDLAGNSLPNLTGGLGLVVDTTAPTATVSSSVTGTGVAINAGRVVSIALHGSEPLHLDMANGQPALALSGGKTATYTGGDGTSTVTFTYTVASGDNVADLAVLGLVANDGGVSDAAGNALASFTQDLGLRVDTTAPVVTGITAVPATTALPGQTIAITVGLSEAVNVAGGTATLTLSDSGTASFDAVATAALGDPTKLVFKHTVSLNQASTSALTVTGIALAGSSIVDVAGNPANLSGVIGQSLGVAVSTDITWTATAPGNWSGAANWSAALVPGATNTVVVAGGPARNDISVTDAEAARTLTVRDPNTLLRVSGTLTVSDGLTVSGFLALAEDLQGGTSGHLVVPGGLTIGSGGAVTDFGVGTIAGSVVNNSTGFAGGVGGGGLDVRSVLDISGGLTGTGTTVLRANSQLTVHGVVSQSIVMEDQGSGGVSLVLGDPADFHGLVAGIAAGDLAAATNRFDPPADSIDLAGVDPATVAFTGSAVTGIDSEGKAFSLHVAGATTAALTDSTFAAVSDGRGGTRVSWQAGIAHTFTGAAGTDWAAAANWNDGLVPGAFDTVIIGGSGALTASVAHGETLDANALDITNPLATLAVAGDLTLGTTPSLGGATIAVAGGALALVGAATLDNAAITLADGSVSTTPDSVSPFAMLLPSASGLLTLGSTLMVTHLGGPTRAASIVAYGTIVNDGTISAGVAGGHLSLASSPQEFASTFQSSTPQVVNNGSILVTGGDELDVSVNIPDNDPIYGSPGFVNTGTLTVAAGSAAHFVGQQWTNQGAITLEPGATVVVIDKAGGPSSSSPGWSNTGTIVVGSGATLTLNGAYAAASLGGITNRGTIVLDGVPADQNALTFNGGTWVIDPADAASLSGPNQSPPAISGSEFIIGAGTTLEIGGDPSSGVYTSGHVVFAGADATLRIDALGNNYDPNDPSSIYGSLGNVNSDFNGAIGGLAAGDTIDFAHTIVTAVEFTSTGLLVTSAAGQQLFVTDAPFTPDQYTLTSDNAGGTSLHIHADTTPPAVTSVTATTGSGAADIRAGDTVTITVALREAVVVTGTPLLKLSNGASASYVSGAGTDTLTFSYTPLPGQDANDLALAGFDFTNGAIADGGSNALSPTLGTDLGIAIDTRTPSIVAVSTPRAVVQPGQTETITLGLSEGVTVSGGTPVLSLSNAGSAIYDAAATAALGDPTRLVFDYTVAATDLTTAAPAITGLQLNGATIADGAGNVADLSASQGARLGFGVNTQTATAGGGLTYFIASVGGNPQVWQTDGTATGTSVISLAGGQAYSNPQNLTATSNAVYFVATHSVPEWVSDPFTGNQTMQDVPQSDLFKVDGAAGVTNLGPVNPGQDLAMIGAVVALGTKLFIVSTDQPGFSSGFNPSPGAGQTVLSVTDGTAAPTTLATLQFGFDPDPIAVDGKLFFLNPDPSNGSSQLWETDGTSGGTQQVDLQVPADPSNPGSQPGAIQIFSRLTAVGNDLYFRDTSSTYQYDVATGALAAFGPNIPTLVVGASTYTVEGGALLKSSAAGTQQIGTGLFAGVESLTLVGGTLFFLATDSSTGQTALWSTHGTDETTADLIVPGGALSGFANLTAVGGKLFFTAFDGTTGTGKLFESDGTLAGTLAVVPATGPAFSNPSTLTANGSTLVFSAYDPVHGLEVWETDGTSAGTGLTADISPGSTPGLTVNSLTAAGGLEYFVAVDPSTNQNAIWRTDGTAAGTLTVRSASGGFDPTGSFAALGTEVYFLAATPAGNVLWKTDGTTAGTQAIGPIGATGLVSVGSSVYGFDDTIYGANSHTLWRIDAGAGSVVAIAPTAGSFNGPNNLQTVGNRLYFCAYNADYTSNDLWTSDGTDSGTVDLAALGSGYPSLTAIGSTLFFPVVSGDSTALWAAQGASTTQLALFAGSSSGPTNLTAVGTTLFFVAGSSLWKSDGTAGGTVLADAATAGNVSTIGVTAAGGTLFFLDHDPNTGGNQLWATTAASPAAHQVTGAAVGSVQQNAVVGSDLFFTAYDPTTYQTSLWRTDGLAADTVKITGAFTSSSVTTLSSLGGALFFFATDPGTGQQALWSVGTGSAVAAKVDLGGVQVAGALTVSGSGLLFSGTDGSTGRQLYIKDSTGTHALTSVTSPQNTYTGAITAGPAVPPPTHSGFAVDGYIAGGTVFADANDNGTWDPGEAETTTDGQGHFTLQGGSGALVVQGGVDSSTQLTFAGTMKAPAGSTVITPLTTLVDALLPAAPTSTDLANAESAVLAAFGLTLGAGQSLTTLDPVAGTLAGNAAATAVYAAGATVIDTVTIIGTALATTGATGAVFDAVTRALAAKIAAAPAGQALDLTAGATVKAVIASAATSLGVNAGLSSSYTQTIADAVTASNTALSDAQASGGQNVLQAIAAAQQAAAVPTSLAPVVTEALSVDGGASSSDGITNNPTLSGSGDSNAIVHFALDGAPVSAIAVADQTGAWTYVPTALTDGPHTIVASESSRYGTGSASLTFTLDTTAPAVTIATPSETTSQATLQVSGVVTGATTGATLVLYDGQAQAGTTTLNADGSWSRTLTLSEGDNVISAQVADAAGNVGVSSAITATLQSIRTVTQTQPDGSTKTSTYQGPTLLDVKVTGIPGAAYTSTEALYGANGVPTSTTYKGVTNQPYTSYTSVFGATGSLIGTTYYTATGSIYAVLTRAADYSFTIAHPGVTGQLYTSYTNAYAANGTRLSTSYFGYTNPTYASTTAVYGTDGRVASITYKTAAGATYAVLTYAADRSYTAAHPGVTGQAYTSYTNSYSTSGALVRVVQDGFTNQPYTSTTSVFGANNKITSITYKTATGGTYAVLTYAADRSYTVVHPNVSGQPYTSYTNSCSATGALTGSMYSGYTGRTYDTAETVFGSPGKQVFEAFLKNGVMTQTESWNADGSVQGVVNYGVAAGTSVTNTGLFAKSGFADTWTIGAPLANSGTITVATGALTLAKGLANTGTLDVGPAAKVKVIGALSGGGQVSVHGAGSVLDLGPGASSTIGFTDGAAATLLLEDASHFTGHIQGFGSNSILDLAGFSGSSSLTYTRGQAPNSGSLNVTDGSHQATLAMLGSYTSFTPSSDLAGGLLIKLHA